MECTAYEEAAPDEDDTPFSELTGNTAHFEKMERFGLTPSADRNQHTTRTEKKNMDKLFKDMQTCMTEEQINEILDSKPRAYPPRVNMDPDAMKLHVTQGRRFELSMMLYDVQKCKCCGKVQPGHVDSLFPKDKAPYQREHLINTYHRAWECNCWGFCKGSQFYCANKPTHMDEYKRQHEGMTPLEFLNLTEPNALL
eukprot:scaffold315718_cov96-Cyclotella_meneghiniana.AAC.1